MPGEVPDGAVVANVVLLVAATTDQSDDEAASPSRTGDTRSGPATLRLVRMETNFTAVSPERRTVDNHWPALAAHLSGVLGGGSVLGRLWRSSTPRPLRETDDDRVRDRRADGV